MKRGFSLVELLMAVGTASVVGLMGLTAIGQSLEKARGVKCLGNLRQWGVALQCYLQDSGGLIPRRGQGVRPVWVIDREEDWFNCLPRYMESPSYNELYKAGKAPKPKERSIFVCPSARVTNDYTHFISYGMNMYLSRWDQAERTRITQVPSPSSMAFLADSPGGYASTVPSRQPYSVAARHGGHANVVFLDGHAAAFPGEYLGCETGERTQPDVRWQTGIEGDLWRPVY